MEAAPVGAPAPGPGAVPTAAPAEETGVEAAVRALRDDPASFGFFQAVRLLERLRPGRARLGAFGPPDDEPVRFSVHPSLAFPPGELHAVSTPDAGPAEMTVNFMGLTGPGGVLPAEYTLRARKRGRDGEKSALAAFLDLFHHRVLSLFYRAWEKSRATLPAERGEDGPLRRHLLDLVGEGESADEGGRGAPRPRIDDRVREALVRYAGLFAPVPRSALGLEQLLGDVLGVPAAVEQFVGGWHPLAPADQCRLGGDEEGEAGQLGVGAVVGGEAWHPQSGIRVRLGPLDRAEYERFLPTGSAFPLLRRLVRFYTHDQFECELRLVLAAAEVPPCMLGAEGAAAQPLGWSTWARSRPLARDADDTLLRL